MILITGAAGQLGSAIIGHLLKSGFSQHEIIAFVKGEVKTVTLKEKGVTVAVGNYNDYQSLLKAFKGVDKLMFISSSEIADRVAQHANVVNAAVEVGVKHILYTSFQRKNDAGNSPVSFIGDSHISTEKAIKQSGLNYTIFRNNLYAETVPMFVGEKVPEHGIFLPVENAKVAFTLRDDMADAIANVLVKAGHENKEYVISSTENVSFQQVADIISDLIGSQVSFNSPTAKDYQESLLKSEVPVDFVSMLCNMAEGMRQGEFETFSSDLEYILKRKPTSIRESLANFYKPSKPKKDG